MPDCIVLEVAARNHTTQLDSAHQNQFSADGQNTFVTKLGFSAVVQNEDTRGKENLQFVASIDDRLTINFNPDTQKQVGESS